MILWAVLYLILAERPRSNCLSVLSKHHDQVTTTEDIYMSNRMLFMVIMPTLSLVVK